MNQTTAKATLTQMLNVIFTRMEAQAVSSLCMLGNFSCFNCRLLTFSKFTFSKNSFGNNIRVSNGLNPDQDQQNVGPDLDANCWPLISR